MASISRIVNIALLLSVSVCASKQDGPLADFPLPPARFRPRFRYWLPDARVSAAVVADDIASVSAVSAGGVELLPYFNYGHKPVVTDWSVYGFGTPAFNEIFREALQASAAHDLVFDFTLGPNQGAGVPSPAEDPGLAVQLVWGAATISDGETFSGALPVPVSLNYSAYEPYMNIPEAWGDNELVAVVAAEILSSSTSDASGSTYETVLLNETSVADLTSLVKNNSTLAWTAPKAQGGNGSHIIMGIYQRYTHQRECVTAESATTWLGNGSWVVDHFSAAGAQKTTGFWDQYVLDDQMKSLLAKTGEYSWEDSTELAPALYWTPDFLQRFERARGYSAVKYLPVLFQAQDQPSATTTITPMYSTNFIFDMDAPDGGKYAEDYRLTLNEGYQEYLAHYRSWAASLGLTHSCQPAYNLPLDMSADIPSVDAPELETLAFAESIDAYRQFTGAAHLSGRNTISTEFGAEAIDAYSMTVPSILKLFRDSFAAGVNSYVIHGYPYSGPYVGTTWPGFTTFWFVFTEMWGPRQPVWSYLNDTLLWTARNTLVQKTGVPRVDLAFYSLKQRFDTNAVYPLSDLSSSGFSYEYLGPDNLASSEATVSGKLLAADGPAYKALVIFNQTEISPSASAALVKFAEAGLPIIIVTPIPNKTIGRNGQDVVAKNMAQLTSGRYGSVKVVGAVASIAQALANVGIAPRAAVAAVHGANKTSDVFFAWRSDAASGLELVYILNRGDAATFEIEFDVSADSTPYVLDAWTGEQTRLLSYQKASSGIKASIALESTQSTIVAFVSKSTGDNASLHATSTSSNIASLLLNANNQMEALVSDNNAATVSLSDGKTVQIPAGKADLAPLTLGPWNLTITSYAAPDILSNDSVDANITKISVPDPLKTLLPWTNISGFESISGIGTYTTAFSLSADTRSEAFTLHFTGRVLNTIRVWLNGQLLRPVDPAAPGAGIDISDYVVGLEGSENVLQIDAASTLFNAVKLRITEITSATEAPQTIEDYTEADWAEFGLLGEVIVKRSRRVAVGH